MSRILQARDLSSYPKNRINDETRKVLEMALVRNTRSNDSSLYTNITVYQCVGPPVHHRVHTNIADKGRGIEMVSAPA
jgi:hypothetical protein